MSELNPVLDELLVGDIDAANLTYFAFANSPAAPRAVARPGPALVRCRTCWRGVTASSVCLAPGGGRVPAPSWQTVDCRCQ